MNAKNEFSVHFTIDWISATFEPYQAKRFGKHLGYGAYLADVAVAPTRGYNKAVELESGLRINWHTERDDMGVHFTLSGSTLRWYYAKGLTWYDMLTLIKKHKGRTSRVDLAFDLLDSGLRQAHLTKGNLLSYKGKGRTPRILPVGTQEDGWTVYVGSRSSDKYLRIYDKGKEQREENSDYVRIELETKGEIAHAVGWQFPELGQSDAIRMAQTLISDMANFNHASYQTALRTERVELAAPQGRERDTFGWLMKVCAPALAKEIAKRPNSPVIDEFWDALRAALRERGIEA